MVIVLFFDNKYFHFVEPLVKSISIKEPDTKIYAHTFNLSQNQTKEIESYPNVSFVEEQIKFDYSIADKYDIGLNKGKPLRFQLTCRRGKYVLDAMKHFSNQKLFVIMDVDTLVIQPLDELKRKMKNHDVGVVWVGKDKIASGFFAVKNTERGIHYLKQFYNVAMNGRLFLCKDQKSMAKVYEDVKNKTNFLLIDRRYLDYACSEDAFVWSGHKSQYGTKDEKCKLYINVVNKLNNKKMMQKHIKNYQNQIRSRVEEAKRNKERKKERIKKKK